jgi:cyclopropane fatty-acyl-phospholipid synthase-like methyltransferase
LRAAIRLVDPVVRDLIRRRNRELYDDAMNQLWQRLVYDPVHRGRPMINMAGWPFVADLLREFPLRPNDRLLDLGAGTGAIAAAAAEATGATVIAVEMNPCQAKRIRRQSAGLRNGRIELVEEDAAAIVLEGPVDLAISIDTLMLVPDWRTFLRSGQSLAGGRHRMFAATTILDRRLCEAERRLFWEEDGMFALPGAEQAVDLIEQAGFAPVSLRDRNAEALRALGQIGEALALEESRTGDLLGASELANWRRMNEAYGDALQAGRMTYVEVRAHWAGGDRRVSAK